MAIVKDGTTTGTQGANTTVISWSHTCTAGDSLLIVCIGTVDSTSADRTISGVTYNGDALTDSTIDCDDATNGFRTEIWYRINPDTGAAYTIEVTAGGKCTDIGASAIAFAGTDTTDPIGNSNTAATTGTNPSVSVNNVVATSWLIGCIVTDESDALAIYATPPDISSGEQDLGADVYSGIFCETPGSGTQTLDFTDSFSFAYVISAVEILAAGAGGFNSKVMVDGAWKAVSSASVMVDGAWKEVNSMKVMVDGVWKAV